MTDLSQRVEKKLFRCLFGHDTRVEILHGEGWINVQVICKRCRHLIHDIDAPNFIRRLTK